MHYSLQVATLTILDILKHEGIRLFISELSARKVHKQPCGKDCLKSFGTYTRQRRTADTAKDVEAWFFQMERRQGTL